MSGSAGLSPSRNRKPEGSTSSEYARNSRKEFADLAAGQAVLTAENKNHGHSYGRIVGWHSDHQKVVPVRYTEFLFATLISVLTRGGNCRNGVLCPDNGFVLIEGTRPDKLRPNYVARDFAVAREETHRWFQEDRKSNGQHDDCDYP